MPASRLAAIPMQDFVQVSPLSAGVDVGRDLPRLTRWRRAWDGSLRFRLLALGLVPLLIAFPIVIALVLWVGGESARSLLQSNLRSNLAGTRNYLDQLRADAGSRVGELVKSERLNPLRGRNGGRGELDRLLATSARGAGLDFLIIAAPDGTVIASSTGVAPGRRLPDSHVIREAGLGMVNAAYERIEASDLAAFSPQFPAQARMEYSPLPESGPQTSTRGLLINAAAHFPLTVDDAGAILVGGILLNRNFPVVERMREIIFPVGALPGDAEGMTSIYVDDVSAALSRQRQQGQRSIGTRAPAEVADRVIGSGQPWLGTRELAGQSYIAGYQPIVDGDGHRVGMIGVGFPDAPYLRVAWVLLGLIACLLALTMLVLSLTFLRAGRELTQRLANIGETMTRVRRGDRRARVGATRRGDELDRLARDFDVLLDTVAAQDAMQRDAQQSIADEASRRRALFEHERDGVAILNADGSVFEVNPKCAAMLGYTIEEMSRLHVVDWQSRGSPADIDRILEDEGPEGRFFETVHRRKDGSTYAAEVSTSRAEWGDRSFLLVLHRDISERKAVESELESYRLELERLVDRRTQELNDRSEQLNAIFTLSPDGFVSFDRGFRVAFANRAFLRMVGMDRADIVGLDEGAFSAGLAGKCLPHAAFPGVEALRAARQRLGDGPEADKAGAARRQLIELDGPGSRVLEVGIRISEADNVSQILYFRDVTHETEVARMKSEFLSTAAHELRTPMASIYGYAELLQAREFDDGVRRELLSTIFRQSSLMASIIDELLDLARIEARRGKDFVIERIALQDIVAEAVAGFKPAAERPPPVIAKCATPLFVDADRRKMQQALLNILSNAYKYSPNRGDVDIAYRIDDDDGNARVGVEVRDHGIGMTAAQGSRVCERFYRVDTSGQFPGTGLGMSIVKEIVELHGGDVELVSEVGVGTTVTLWFPAAAAPCAAAASGCVPALTPS